RLLPDPGVLHRGVAGRQRRPELVLAVDQAECRFGAVAPGRELAEADVAQDAGEARVGPLLGAEGAGQGGGSIAEDAAEEARAGARQVALRAELRREAGSPGCRIGRAELRFRAE